MGSAPSSRAINVQREKNVEPSVLSKAEKAKVTKLFHRQKTDESGAIPLSTVTRLVHFRNNALVKLVATQYARKQDAVAENASKASGQNDPEEVMDLEKFIELFDILSPKKDSSSKLEVLFNALKNKENGFIMMQELANFLKLLFPSSLPQANIDAMATNMLHQSDRSSGDATSSPQHSKLSLEDFTKAVSSGELLARLSVEV